MRIRSAAISLLVICHCWAVQKLSAQATENHDVRVVITSDGWKLIADLMLPEASAPPPAVLMLNKAVGDRKAYVDLARHLAGRGIASLRLDLRGHGESVNLGRFIPGEIPRSPLIWDS